MLNEDSRFRVIIFLNNGSAQAFFEKNETPQTVLGEAYHIPVVDGYVERLSKNVRGFGEELAIKIVWDMVYGDALKLLIEYFSDVSSMEIEALDNVLTRARLAVLSGMVTEADALNDFPRTRLSNEFFEICFSSVNQLDKFNRKNNFLRNQQMESHRQLKKMRQEVLKLDKSLKNEE